MRDVLETTMTDTDKLVRESVPVWRNGKKATTVK